MRDRTPDFYLHVSIFLLLYCFKKWDIVSQPYRTVTRAHTYISFRTERGVASCFRVVNRVNTILKAHMIVLFDLITMIRKDHGFSNILQLSSTK